jgi:hypothetical protein
LTTDEIRDLRRHLGLPDTASRDIVNRLPQKGERSRCAILTRALLVPLAGLIDKKILDVHVDKVKRWLDRPEVQDRKVEIYGPDDKVVRIVKTGKEIRTSEEDFKFPRTDGLVADRR